MKAQMLAIKIVCRKRPCDSLNTNLFFGITEKLIYPFLIFSNRELIYEHMTNLFTNNIPNKWKDTPTVWYHCNLLVLQLC